MWEIKEERTYHYNIKTNETAYKGIYSLRIMKTQLQKQQNNFSLPLFKQERTCKTVSKYYISATMMTMKTHKGYEFKPHQGNK